MRPFREPRHHQRIRFSYPPAIKLGYDGELAYGVIENLSVSGLMLRSGLEPALGRHLGCEFSVFGSPLIDIPATVISRSGNLSGLRFDPGPINRVLLDDAIGIALAEGHASILRTHEIDGRRIMRITGALSGNLRGDFAFSLAQGIEEIDLSAVTAIDLEGLSLCLGARDRHGVLLGKQSACFIDFWKAHSRKPGRA